MVLKTPVSLPIAERLRSPLRLAVPAAALLLYGGLAALWHWGPHAVYFRILRLFAVEPFRFPFLDTHAVLAAVQCRRLGIDVYLTNPCDALGRRHAYSPLWLRITPEFLETSATTVGLALGLSFIISLAALSRPASRGEVPLMAFTALSPVTVYALERANSDLVVFLLILAGCALLRAPRLWRFGAYGLFLFAGLLKYYPLILLVLITRERRRDALLAGAAAGFILLILVLCDYGELREALASIPALSYYADSFAAVNLPFGLAAALRDNPFPRALAPTFLTVLAVLTIARIRRSLQTLDLVTADSSPFGADCLVVGCLLLTACFFAGQNVYYRGIYFMLVMPGLLHLRRNLATAEMHQFLTLMISAVMFVAWEEVLRSLIAAGAATMPSEELRVRVEIFFWLGRELVWWWLIAGLAAIALSFLRQLQLEQEAIARFRRCETSSKTA